MPVSPNNTIPHDEALELRIHHGEGGKISFLFFRHGNNVSPRALHVGFVNDHPTIDDWQAMLDHVSNAIEAAKIKHAT